MAKEHLGMLGNGLEMLGDAGSFWKCVEMDGEYLEMLGDGLGMLG